MTCECRALFCCTGTQLMLIVLTGHCQAVDLQSARVSGSAVVLLVFGFGAARTQQRSRRVGWTRMHVQDVSDLQQTATAGHGYFYSASITNSAK